MMFLQAAFLQILVVSIAASAIHYVRTDSPSSSCPGQPCLTLHQYSQINNFTSATTFVFLPGNHSLQQSILYLAHVSNITLRGEESNLAVNILCTNVITIQCESVIGLNIEGLTFTVNHSGYESSLKLFNCSEVFISHTLFQGSGENTGRAMFLQLSTVTIKRCTFKGNSVRDNGGAILAVQTQIKICGCYFIENRARKGGAINGFGCTLYLDGSIPNNLTNNLAYDSGGAINCYYICVLEIQGQNIFQENHCQGNTYGNGGALSLESTELIMSGTVDFSYNQARDGGAIYMRSTKAILNGSISLLKNSANKGGGMYIEHKSIFKNSKHLSYIGNVAQLEGGALYVSDSYFVTSGITKIINNTGAYGGGIITQYSELVLQENTSFASNSATSGGALYSLHGTVSLHNITLFTQNTAERYGGALHAVSTVINMIDKVIFTLNTAHDGGAMYLETGASLTFEGICTPLSTSFNFAHEHGGGIYYEDSATINQCYCTKVNINYIFEKLPDCFFQISDHIQDHCSVINSKNDSAEIDGNFLFGGLLDRCSFMLPGSDSMTVDSFYITDRLVTFDYDSKEKEITSMPYGLCICIDHIDLYYYCGNTKAVQVYRGQMFTVPLQATAQLGSTSTTVTATTSAKAKLETYQTSQPLPDYCHPLSYTVYSTASHEQVVLYPDGPCRDTGSARVVVDVTLLPCPDGFTQSGELCTCEDRLRHYPINCTIDDTPYLTKAADSTFWMGVLYTNTTYRGLILGKSCPAEYCKTDSVRITLDNPDIQCDHHRSGLLCGACATNYSLMLGSSQCQVCPNTYLALLLPFAAAGIALVVFLTFLRLTVATGTLNSVILYANIIQVNRMLFFPANARNVLTVFLAWMNLDLGFQACFYDGLDSYALTWLQFAFPLYVWLLIALMIFVSRYSITVSKLIGSNPIAVLATLLLMSYTKILKIIIDVYSSADLDYPDNKTVTVWLKDADVPYLKSEHLVLTVVTSLVLVFLFIPYTLLLLLGHKLYRFTGRKHWHWLIRLKPLLDSYYAPYKTNTRYWTGFLLIVRCVLYTVFLLYSLNSRKCFVAIAITFTTIYFAVGYVYSGKIYKSFYTNLLEGFIYLNLIVLSVTTQTGFSTTALVYLLIGLVFVIVVALSVNQFHHLYISKTTLWLRLKSKWPHFRKDTISTTGETPHANNTSHDPHKIVTKTVIELREPLLEN